MRTFWQSEDNISVLALWLCALSSLCHNMGVGEGMDVILSLYVPGMFRGVWKNVLTLNVLYTDLSSLWMPGRTHYTHVCILCPHFECRARYGCVYECNGSNIFMRWKMKCFIQRGEATDEWENIYYLTDEWENIYYLFYIICTKI